MTSQIFEDFIVKWDKELSSSQRKILLLLDNFSGHKIDYIPSNIKFLFLMPNSTSKSQPLDAGIIKSFKDKYTSLYHTHLLQCLKDKDIVTHEAIKQVDLLKVIEFVAFAWNQVSEETIINCWRHTGLRTCSQTTDSSVFH